METPAAPRRPKFVRWALMVGIVIMLNVFFSSVLAIAYPEPQYTDFCPTEQTSTPTDAATCDSQGGMWTEYNGAPAPQTPSGYCDMSAKCQVPYQAASDKHALYAFIVMVSLGVIALIAGLMPIGSSIVSSGLSYGGVVALIIGSMQYWSAAGNWIRLAITTIALIALIYIGWRRFRD